MVLHQENTSISDKLSLFRVTVFLTITVFFENQKSNIAFTKVHLITEVSL